MSKPIHPGAEIPKLGFGAMRLPVLENREIDLEQVKAMVDLFLANGFTYFDTAYMYHGGQSETALREALVKRHPRGSFYLADKMPVWEAKTSEDYERLFKEQLEKTGAGYFDFYLLHALGKDRLEALDQLGGWAFLQSIKADGRAKHIGFSFHDTADVLDQILSAHPEVDFVQLQINYMDWEDGDVQSRKLYEVARKYGCPVVIMEPVKGGSLASMPEAIRQIFVEANPEASVASWALRYCASLEGVVTVLSGMSNLSQLEDNLSTMRDFRPITAAEHATIDRVVEALKAIPTIPCTSCEYCIGDCPQKINIPGVIASINSYLTYDNLQLSGGHYRFATGRSGKASTCIACGACEEHCPQHIEIIDSMQRAAGLFEQ